MRKAFFDVGEGVDVELCVQTFSFFPVYLFESERGRGSYGCRDYQTLTYCVYRLTPGPVLTDLNRHFDISSVPEEALERLRRTMSPINDVCQGLMRSVDTASRTMTGGGFRDWRGNVIEW